MEAFITIKFEDGKCAFDVRTTKHEQLFTALLGLEGYLATQTGLEAQDIREILDEMKGDVNVTSKEIIDDAIDTELET